MLGILHYLKRRAAVRTSYSFHREEQSRRVYAEMEAKRLEEQRTEQRAYQEYLKTPEGKARKRQQDLANMIAEKVAAKITADRRKDEYNRETEDRYGGPSYIGGF